MLHYLPRCTGSRLDDAAGPSAVRKASDVIVAGPSAVRKASDVIVARPGLACLVCFFCVLAPLLLEICIDRCVYCYCRSTVHAHMCAVCLRPRSLHVCVLSE